MYPLNAILDIAVLDVPTQYQTKLELEAGTDVLLLETGDALLIKIDRHS